MNRLDLMLDYAKRMVGVPYIWGGSTPMGGLDCSGFVQECLAAVGADPAGDQTAQILHNHFKQFGPTVTPKAGALAFFGAGTAKVSHVAICLDDRFMIEAGGGGSKTESLKDAIKQQAFVRIRPIDRRNDLVACYFPL